ncbi:transcriptional regulator [Actinocatenispora thailandica]|uniref:Transcriptional regulator n=1 Tax=Actinocatenispora thailandica TaxID=227318 RepID=A0A7R7HWT2_9ACTN|nr:transcriptional regulator [Actinocatenispora thailandica]BCJ35106.1 transcriptional regulator [Actinocatenispora thailandica]
MGDQRVAEQWVAWPAGSDPGVLGRALAGARDRFMGTGTAGGPVRQVVAESWRRSAASGIDPDQHWAPVELTDDVLRDLRADHQLAAAMPVVRRLLLESAGMDGLIVAVGDAAGRLLWVEGDRQLRARAESMHFLAGSNWGERHAGTNAVGMALAVDHSVQVFGAEHFARRVVPWSCSAAPVHDPDTGAVLGFVDVTGGDHVAAPHTLALVRATAVAVESELRVQRLARPRPVVAPEPAQLTVCGDVGRLRLPHRGVELSLRHAELLLVLSEHPAGRSAEQLAVALYPGTAPGVTVRAELSRLRALLPELALRSRPYRLGRPVATDLAQARALLARGSWRRALALAGLPVLARSQAPEVVALRAELAAQLRAAVLASRDATALVRFADSELGAGDTEVVRATLAALPADSPRRREFAVRLARLDAELGVPRRATRMQRWPS